MEVQQQKNECCKNFANIKFLRSENINDLFSRTVYCCMTCNNIYYGTLTEIKPDSQSFKVIEELNKKGLSLDTLIVGGKSAIKFLIPDIPKLIEKTREMAKLKKVICEKHDIEDIFVDENGIFCRNCGLKLVLMPAWVFGHQE